MDDALAVHVNQRSANLARVFERVIGRKGTLVAQLDAQRNPLDVLHRDIHPAFAPGRVNLDDIRMVEPADDLFLALEASIENHVALELCVGDLDRDGLATDLVDGFENRSHSAPGNKLRKFILIELIADVDLAHMDGVPNP